MQRLKLHFLLLPLIGIFSTSGGSMNEPVIAGTVAGKTLTVNDTLPTVLTRNRADFIESRGVNQFLIENIKSLNDNVSRTGGYRLSYWFKLLFNY